MQQTPDGDGAGPDVGAAFADPAFAELKARGAPFAILRPDSGEVLWANAAAAAHWNVEDAVGLARALFGADGRGGWLDGLRPGGTRGLASRAHTALVRTWTDEAGRELIGLAVADAAPPPALDVWRQPAWTAPEPAVVSEPAAAEPSSPGAPLEGEAGHDGATLARRGHVAVLRDRLSRALGGAATLRLLWRTDASGALTAIDTETLARLGSPLRPGTEPWPDAVAAFDPAGSERLRAVLAGRATWSGVSFDLPVAGATVPMVLSASPAFGPGRGFAGFRGFGTLDLGRLRLPTEARASVSQPVREGRTAEGESLVVPRADPALERPTDRDVASAADGTATPAEAAEPGPPEARPGSASAEASSAPAGSPAPVEAPRPPGNVVHLRAFQGAGPVRAAVAPPPIAPTAADGAPHETAPEFREEPIRTGREEIRGEDGSTNDQLAFLALGEALRARIGAPAAGATSPAGREALPPGAQPRAGETLLEESPTSGPQPRDEGSRDAVAALLDRLPVPVLATVGERPVYANAAAAARLGVAAPAASVNGSELLSATDAVSATARRIEATWGGAPATLWILSGSEPAEAPLVAPEAGEPVGEGPAAELLDRVDDAVALLDAAGRVRRLNRRGEAWFSRSSAEPALGRDFADLLAPESRPTALTLLDEVRNRRDGLATPPLRREVAALAGEGDPVPMLLTLGRLGDAGFYATLRDVGALKRAETDRVRSERDHARVAGRLPDLLARMSHEIRTPLGAVLGFAEVMMDERFGPLGNPRYKDYLKDIHAAGAQVVALVEDLLDLSRIEAGQVDLAVAAVDINRVVAETVAQMQPEAHKGRVIMRTSLGGRVPAASADERSARQIVMNLLSNAVKFNEPGGQVIVSTAPGESGGALLRVRDTGVGMTDEEIAAALEPFGGLPTRVAPQGSGLGLPLTRALVGANGASMTIRSRPREGTLVEVAFAPAEPGEARRPA